MKQSGEQPRDLCQLRPEVRSLLEELKAKPEAAMRFYYETLCRSSPLTTVEEAFRLLVSQTPRLHGYEAAEILFHEDLMTKHLEQWSAAAGIRPLFAMTPVGYLMAICLIWRYAARADREAGSNWVRDIPHITIELTRLACRLNPSSRALHFGARPGVALPPDLMSLLEEGPVVFKPEDFSTWAPVLAIGFYVQILKPVTQTSDFGFGHAVYSARRVEELAQRLLTVTTPHGNQRDKLLVIHFNDPRSGRLDEIARQAVGRKLSLSLREYLHQRRTTPHQRQHVHRLFYGVIGVLLGLTNRQILRLWKSLGLFDPSLPEGGDAETNALATVVRYVGGLRSRRDRLRND